ncbi:insulinase family protein [bacterium]|nr:insulinase family protein [bacterium]
MYLEKGGGMFQLKKKGFDFFQFKKGRTPDGIPIYVKNLPWIKGWIEIRIIIRAGARNDPPGKEGLAHFLEHMLIKGSPDFPNEKEFLKRSRKLFPNDSWNIYTTRENTCFKGKVSVADFPEAMDFLRNLIFYPFIREEDIDKERRIIIREIRERFTSQKWVELKLLMLGDLYRDHPYSRMLNAAGWEKTVNKIIRKDLISFHQKYYHLGNLTLVFVGDINLRKAYPLANRFTKGIAKDKPNPLPKKITAWPGPCCLERNISYSEYFETKELLKSTDLTMGRVIPKQENPAFLKVVSELLCDLFYDFLRIKLGKSYSIGRHRYDYFDHHLLQIVIKIPPDSLKIVQKGIKEILTGFGQDKHRERFEEIKSSLIKAVDRADYNAEEIANGAVGDLSSEGRIISLKEIKFYRSLLTYEDLCKFVAKELGPEKLYWLILKP